MNSARETEVEAYREWVNPSRVAGYEELGWTEDFTRAEGSFLYTSAGEQYLDMVMGFGASLIGYNHPEVLKSIREALASGLPGLMPFGTPAKTGLLARELCELSGDWLRKVYFCNSGAEGIEAALKFASATTGRERFISFDGCYHGLTLGALALTPVSSYWRSLFPVAGVVCNIITLGDLEDVEKQLASGDIAGIVIEIIQGVGGGQQWTSTKLNQLSQLCRHYGSVLIVDEVLTALGRTGQWYAYQHFNLSPDIVVLSKALTGGLIPTGAVLMTDRVFQAVFGSLSTANVHGSTFSGNLMAMTTGLAVVNQLKQHFVTQRVNNASDRLLVGLKKIQEDLPVVSEIRGQGLLQFIRIQSLEPEDPASGSFTCCQLLRELGVLTTLAGGSPSWLKLTPALTISDEEIDIFLSKLRVACTGLGDYL